MLLLAVVASPVFTNDFWWHLALGRAYAAHGPWLAEDPLLFTAPGAPAPAAWLADLIFWSVHALGGFPALRAFHVVVVGAIVWLAWSSVARASRSRVLANLATALFVVMASYRLVQLRPHLFSMLATLALYRILFAGERPPERRHVAVSLALLALWANLHAGFLLGPILIAVALAGLVIARVLETRELRAFASPQIHRVFAALVLGTLATGLDPAGIAPHMAYWIAGDETPSLARVGDEWSHVNPFAIPEPTGFPEWLGLWVCIVATTAATIAIARRSRREPWDFVRLGLAAVSIALMITAVRFSWLAFFPLLFACASLAPAGIAPRPAWRAVVAAATLLLIPLYAFTGTWPNLARGLAGGYTRDYPPEKYHAYPVWWLQDVEARGRLFAEYSDGGFIGYWLAPRIRTFANGSLNVTREAIDANLPIRERRGARKGETFTELLDRLGIDLFVGIRLPKTPPGSRPWYHTTAHLERTSGWIPVFRNLDSAVYLRDLPRNRSNLERMASYYRDRGVAFDPRRGFDPAAAIEQSPAWSIQHGVVPRYFEELASLVNDRSSPRHIKALALMAEIYAALGLYDRAIECDREFLRARPDANGSQRRLVWSLLRLGRFDDARRRADEFAAYAPADALSRGIIALARTAASGSLEPEELAGRIARMPVFTPAEAARLRGGMLRPEVR